MNKIALSIFLILCQANLFAADRKVTELTASTSVSADDLLMVIDDPSGSPVNKKITVSNFAATMPASGSTTQVQYNNSGVFSGSSNFTFDGEVISVGQSSGDTISSDTGFLTFCGVGSVNNECLVYDFESDADAVTIEPNETGVEKLILPMIFNTDRLLAGGVDSLSYNIPQGGVTGSLVAYYKLEDNTATTAVVDETGVNNGVATANTDTLSTSSGIIGRGLDLVSSNSEYVDLGSNSSLKITGDLTVEVWINTTSTGSAKRIMGNRSASGDNTGWDLALNASNQPTFIVDGASGSQSVTGSTAVTTGSWFQLIAKRSSGVLSLKVNGVSEGTPTGTQSDDIGTSAGNTYIGRTPFTAQYFNGKIDNIRIFSRATTDDEDSQLYNSGNATEASGAGSNVAFLKMEENAGNTSVTDTTGINTVTSSTNTSNLHTSDGLINSGFNFTSSSSEYLDLGSASDIKFTGDFTVEVYIRTTTTGIMRIAGNRSSTGANIGWDLAKDASNHATFIIDEGATSYSVTGTTSLIDGAWHHLVARRSGSTLSLFVDSVSEGTPTGSTSADIGTSAGNTYVGRTPFSAQYFNGDMDSFRLWSRALSNQDILILYNAGRGTDTLAGSTQPNIHIFGSTLISIPAYSQITTSSDVQIQDDLEVDGDVYVGAVIVQDGTAAPSLSAAGQGVIYFDSTSNTFKASMNGGAYADLGSGGGTGDVTGVGDCTGGDCLDGTSDGGTSFALYDGSSNKITFAMPNISSDKTLTFPDATDTLTGKATVDIFTNKTYDTAGSGNVFKINGTAISAITGTGSVALSTSPTFVTPTLGVFSATSGTLSGNLVTGDTGQSSIGYGVVVNSGDHTTAAGGDFAVHNTAGATAFKINADTGHIVTGGAAPTISTGAGDCGTSPSVTGNDTAGVITVGTSPGTVCTATFAVAYGAAPNCFCMNQTTANLLKPVTTTTTLKCTGTLTAADKLSYACFQ